jgi:hypothetical protein
MVQITEYVLAIQLSPIQGHFAFPFFSYKATTYYFAGVSTKDALLPYFIKKIGIRGR